MSNLTQIQIKGTSGCLRSLRQTETSSCLAGQISYKFWGIWGHGTHLKFRTLSVNISSNNLEVVPPEKTPRAQLRYYSEIYWPPYISTVYQRPSFLVIYRTLSDKVRLSTQLIAAYYYLLAGVAIHRWRNISRKRCGIQLWRTPFSFWVRGLLKFTEKTPKTTYYLYEEINIKRHCLDNSATIQDFRRTPKKNLIRCCNYRILRAKCGHRYSIVERNVLRRRKHFKTFVD